MIVVGLGGNVGTREEITERFRRAREALGAVRSAGLYRSAPITLRTASGGAARPDSSGLAGPEQPEFLNSALALAGDWEPRELIALIHEIEAQLGRRRAFEARWGPRTLDLDVLLWDGREIREEGLEVPHARLWERRFALEPLAELVDDARVTAALANVRDQDVSLVASTW